MRSTRSWQSAIILGMSPPADWERRRARVTTAAAPTAAAAPATYAQVFIRNYSL